MIENIEKKIESSENENLKEELPVSSFEKKEENIEKKDIKDIEDIYKNSIFVEEKKEERKDLSEEESKVLNYVKESRGVSVKKMMDVIKRVKKKLNPWGIDKYHDEITKKKDGL